MNTLIKLCQKCGQVKPVSEFHKATKAKDGLFHCCKQCWNKQVREWYAANPRPKLDKAKEWAKSNPDKVKAIQKRYDEKYHDRRLESVRKSSAKHRDRRRDYDRRRYRENPKRDNIKGHKRAARKRSLPDTFTIADWQHALEYFNGCCAVCGRPPGLWHTLAADHWIPLSSPDCPGTVPTNIIPLCHGVDGCNNSKAIKLPDEWLTQQYGKRKAKAIQRRIEDYFRWMQQR